MARSRWPRHRTGLFLSGLALLSADLYSGIGSGADVRLSIHMVQHMVMWVLVAPLLAAGAPIRLAFFAFPRAERRVLARWLHSRTLTTVLGADPLPHRLGARGQLGCLVACMVPMLLVGEWLAVAPAPVYSHYVATLGASALDDQRVAAAIMWAGCLPVCAIPALARLLGARGRGRPGKGARAPTAAAAVRPARP